MFTNHHVFNSIHRGISHWHLKIAGKIFYVQNYQTHLKAIELLLIFNTVRHVIRDVPDIRFRLARYPAIFSNPVPAPVPAKTVPSTGYLSRIVLSPFWQLVELSSPSEWAPYSKHVHLNFKELVSHVDPTVLHVLVVDLCSV